MTESRAAGPRGAGSAAGAGLLQTLARQPGPVPAAALARDLGLPRSTTYHLLAGADRRRFRGAPAGGAPLRAGGDRLRDRQRVSPAGATGAAGPAGARAAGRRIALVTPALEVRHGDERLDGAVPRSGSAERRTPTVGDRGVPSFMPGSSGQATWSQSADPSASVGRRHRRGHTSPRSQLLCMRPPWRRCGGLRRARRWPDRRTVGSRRRRSAGRGRLRRASSRR
jgi:hypothetical protein